VLKSNAHIEEYEYENKNKPNLKSNIYLGKISRIEPSLQAAFVSYGRERHGFLAFNDIQSDYCQIPHDDKDRLKKKEENLRLELKEKSKNVEEIEKTQDDISDLTSTNNKNEIEHVPEKAKDENLPIERNNHFSDLKKRYGIRRYKIQEVIKPELFVLV
jgi:ribonuclease E